MTDSDVIQAVYAKTAMGQLEVQTRSLGLVPSLRRVLILVDGKRHGHALAALIPGQDIVAILRQLVGTGCIASLAPSLPVLPVALAGEAAAEDVAALLSGLPPAELRGPQELDKARHCMINTLNSVFGQNMRLTLLESIAACQTTDDLRRAYPFWLEAMQSTRAGAKRAPEFRKMLFDVL
jgi:hypothetical protein